MISQWEDFTEVNSLATYIHSTYVYKSCFMLQNLKKQINEKIDQESNVISEPKVEPEEEPAAKRLKEEDGKYTTNLYIC